MRDKIDDKPSDDNIYPSYTGFKVPYDSVCARRYERSAAAHRRQFLKELLFIERMQDKALHGVRVHRIFTDPVATKIKNPVEFSANEMKRLRRLLDS